MMAQITFRWYQIKLWRQMVFPRGLKAEAGTVSTAK